MKRIFGLVRGSWFARSAAMVVSFALMTMAVPVQPIETLGASSGEPVKLGQFRQFLPKSFTLDNYNGKSVRFQATETGYEYEVIGQPDRRGVVPYELLDKATISVLDEGLEVGPNKIKGVSAVLSVVDPRGNKRSFLLSGSIKKNAKFVGNLVRPDGKVIDGISVNAPEGLRREDPDDVRLTAGPVVLLVVISAGAVAAGAIGCIGLTLLNNCAAECAAACPYGVANYHEGWCGGCDCSCNPPPQPEP